jgi:hypothetical protein
VPIVCDHGVNLNTPHHDYSSSHRIGKVGAKSSECVLYHNVALDGDLDEVRDCQDWTGVVRHKYI